MKLVLTVGLPRVFVPHWSSVEILVSSSFESVWHRDLGETITVQFYAMRGISWLKKSLIHEMVYLFVY